MRFWVGIRRIRSRYASTPNEKTEAQPGARANGPKQPWLILNDRRKKDEASGPNILDWWRHHRADSGHAYRGLWLAYAPRIRWRPYEPRQSDAVCACRVCSGYRHWHWLAKDRCEERA